MASPTYKPYYVFIKIEKSRFHIDGDGNLTAIFSEGRIGKEVSTGKYKSTYVNTGNQDLEHI
jgi:hypothetical protein